jgi:hypothetical protein
MAALSLLTQPTPLRTFDPNVDEESKDAAFMEKDIEQS